MSPALGRWLAAVILVPGACAAGPQLSGRAVPAPLVARLDSMAGRTGRPAVVGIVLDGASAAPLPHCNVVVLGTKLGTQADTAGLFRLAVPDTGTYRLRVMRVGYGRQTRRVHVAVGRPPTLVVRLPRLRLPPGAVLDTLARY